MFNDGEPEDASYIFGDLSPEPKPPKDIQIQHPIRKVKSLRARRNWKLIRPVDQFFPIGSSVNKETIDTPTAKDKSTDDEYTTMVVPDQIPEHPIYGRNPDIAYDTELDVATEDVDNLVDVPEELLDSILTNSDALADKASDIMLKEGAAHMMSFDKGSSFAVAALRDGLNVEIDIDSSVLTAIAGMTKLNLISMYADSMSSLPADVKSLFLRKMAISIAEDTHKNMVKTVTGDKYSSTLQNLAARVKATMENSPPLGTTQSRNPINSGRTNPYKQNSETQTTNETHDQNTRQSAGVRITDR